MKIQHLLDSISIATTNEESKFISSHADKISLSALDEHEKWIARNLVRRGIYKITKDNNHIVINKSHEPNRPTL